MFVEKLHKLNLLIFFYIIYIVSYGAAIICEHVIEHSTYWNVTELWLFWFLLDGILHASMVYYVVPQSMRKQTIEDNMNYNRASYLLLDE